MTRSMMIAVLAGAAMLVGLAGRPVTVAADNPVAAAPPASQPADEFAWGEVVNGMQLGVQLRAKEIKREPGYRGNDTIARLRLRNVGEKPLFFCHSEVPPGALGLKIVDASGAEPRYRGPGSNAPYRRDGCRTLKPGEQMNLFVPVAAYGVPNDDGYTLTAYYRAPQDKAKQWLPAGSNAIAWGGEVTSEKATVAAKAPSSQPAEPLLAQDPKGNFVLFVGNQSPTVTPVDIVVTIDGKKAVDANFALGMGRNIVRHAFLLPPGEHTLIAVSKKGRNVVLKQTIKVGDAASFGILFYTGGGRTPTQFTFRIQDTEPMFM